MSEDVRDALKPLEEQVLAYILAAAEDTGKLSERVIFRKVFDQEQDFYSVHWRETGLLLGCLRRGRDEDGGRYWEERFPWDTAETAWMSAYRGNREQAARNLMKTFVYCKGTEEDEEAP